MPLNWETKDTEYFVDQENQMMNQQVHPWKTYGNEVSIQRNFISFVCYEDKRFIEGIKWCWEKREETNWFRKTILRKKYRYQGFLYPSNHENMQPITRDQLAYTLIALKYAKATRKDLREFVNHLPYKISKGNTFSFTLWLWARAICGSPIHTLLYYLFEAAFLKFKCFQNSMIYKIVPFDEERDQESWVQMDNSMKTERIKKWSARLYPVSELHIKAWQIFLLRDCWWNKLMKRVCINIIPKHNYAIQMLLGKKVSKKSVNKYLPMFGNRWDSILNPFINTRDLFIICDPTLTSFNCLDVDYVKKLHVVVNK